MHCVDENTLFDNRQNGCIVKQLSTYRLSVMSCFFLVVSILFFSLNRLRVCVFSFGLVSNCYSLIAADVRNCAMKLLYSKMTWSFCGFPDGLPLTPVAKFVCKGMGLVVGFPFTSAIANLKGSEYAPTLSNLCVGVWTWTSKTSSLLVAFGSFWNPVTVCGYRPAPWFANLES